ncbi:hypothetical protein O781_02710 [Staphylococcus aureus M0176]|nr:hypothetical protein O781_02710 [Staphylococcus aureus M0176]
MMLKFKAWDKDKKVMSIIDEKILIVGKFLSQQVIKVSMK